jgi:hypothetical protein
MADVEVIAAELSENRVKSLKVRFKNAPERTIDRDTALAWLAAGHSLNTYAGPSYHPVKGESVERVEVDGEDFLRTDTQKVARDELHFPHGH